MCALSLASVAVATDLQNRPAAPEHVQAIAISADTIEVKWADSSRYETGYTVSFHSLAPHEAGGTIELPANSTHATISGLAPYADVAVYIWGHNSLGVGLMASTFANTGMHIISARPLSETFDYISTTDRIACRVDGTCAVEGYTRSSALGCSNGVSGCRFIAKFSAAGELTWVTLLNNSVDTADIAISVTGEVAITGIEGDLDLVVQKFSSDTGALLWSKSKGGLNADGSDQTWWGNAIAFDPSGSNIYVAGGHDFNSSAGDFTYGIIERFTSATGANTQIANITGTSNLNPIDSPTKNADFFDIIVRSDGVPVGVGYRTFEQETPTDYLYREDLIVRFGGASNGTLKTFSGPADILSGFKVIEEPVTRNILVLASEASYQQLPALLYKLSPTGTLVDTTWPKDLTSEFVPFKVVDAGIDNSGDIWLLGADIVGLSAAGEFKFQKLVFSSTLFRPLTGGAVVGGAIIGTANIPSYTPTRFDWIELTSNGQRGVIVRYSTSETISNELNPPTCGPIGLKCVRPDCSSRQVTISLPLADDHGVSVATKMRFSFGDGPWSAPETFRPNILKSIPGNVTLPTRVRLQFRDKDLNWSTTYGATIRPTEAPITLGTLDVGGAIEGL